MSERVGRRPWPHVVCEWVSEGESVGVRERGRGREGNGQMSCFCTLNMHIVDVSTIKEELL